MSVKLGIIGGTGVYNPEILTDPQEQTVSTPYGEVRLIVGNFCDRSVAFMNRHGAGHSVPPHLVNYRANIAALKKLGVKTVLATAAVGSLNPSMEPGHLVFTDQFLDFTKTRQTSFFDGGPAGVVHIDMTNPYCPELRDTLYRTARELGLMCHPVGIYICTEGPRFETAAEIKMYRRFGGDLVGMTGVPEVVLAREAEMCYATVAMVTNYAAGISPTNLTHQEVLDTMASNSEHIRKLLMQTVASLDPERNCSCQHALNPLVPA
ncbi:MAG: S-methyl-5'-thioinosine phosphorylase [Pelotomaculum sp. PtaB.Bin104]|nr:MAG: S-methyl-5'-thioinosine phosphorylase [Pelotomaculum sp. PtaB.Bin104]